MVQLVRCDNCLASWEIDHLAGRSRVTADLKECPLCSVGDTDS